MGDWPRVPSAPEAAAFNQVVAQTAALAIYLNTAPEVKFAVTGASALTPKATFWNVMQITKIHFVTSAALVVANPEASIVVFLDRPARLRCSMLMGSILTLARFPIRAGLEAN